MEYNIRSNDDDANEIILTSLKDLDTIFFVEHSDSENEEDDENLSDEELDDKELDDEEFDNEKLNDELPDIEDDDFNLDKLNKLVEFVDIPDNYIEDKIYDELKSEVRKFFKKKKCSCRSTKQPCFEKIGYEQFLKRCSEFESLDKKRWRYNYCYNNDIKIWHSTYLALVGISQKYLENIVKHFRDHGLEVCVHGNTGRAPKNMNRIELSYDIACDVYQFLKNYSNIHALIPSLQFMSPKSDLCETCKTMKMEIQHATQYEKKVELTENYIAHLNHAQKEHDYYNNNIMSAVKDGKRNPNLKV
ncbi:chaperonin: PROVISIONAL [Gigaspora margarita]|uniref:Chaperonin: PROVISIONAL n=1 Tax=Gigaspora margarita TaxID=4874 RepID=A0A8H4B2P3_GIGMA|nr:chaperonin: PROVISIONAL [Gigaspora margarita]